MFYMARIYAFVRQQACPGALKQRSSTSHSHSNHAAAKTIKRYGPLEGTLALTNVQVDWSI
jgi:hypothetical protein